ncbi:MAG: hypothetical protein V4718_11315 [Pseudomonadota bacterium]
MLALVSHDAGGAEILSSYIRQRGLPCLYVLEGPAVQVFGRKLGAIQTTPLAAAISQASSLLCGTSWQSDLEFNALGLAREAGKPSAAFLDHWVNYRERFTRGSDVRLPDEIWVGDSIARNIAAAVLPGVPVRLVDNPYFADLRAELGTLVRSHAPASDSLSVLYVCEPVREHMLRQFGNARHLGYVEEEALTHFLGHIHTLGKAVSRVVVRPHPSEARDKYDWAQAQCPVPLVRGGGQTLMQEIVDCDVVVGCESMAMVVALLAGKRVISCIPPGGRRCVLPYPEIELLSA